MGFLEYEPLLWRVLGSLTRDGFLVQPQDARDIIHDFYLEWPSLAERFDAGKGEFTTYVASAFYRFGRRRQLQLHRLRSRAVELEACLDLAAQEPSPPEVAEWRQRLAQLQAAVATLPAAEQALLADFLSDHAPAERELAQKHRLTRYRLREQLAATVSRVALHIMHETPQSDDARIAYQVWVADQSPRCVAAELGLSTEQVNAAKSRFARALLDAVRSADGPQAQGRKTMPDLDILRNALTAFNDYGALEQVRTHAPHIRAALEGQDLVLGEDDSAAVERHPEWLAEVYASLGEGAPEGALDEAQQQLAHLLSDEQLAMADAWAALLEKLDAMRAPAAPGTWESALQGGPRPDPALLRYLREQPSCRQGDAAAQRLLQYGLTPAMLFEALHRMELLFNRALRRGGSHPAQRAAGLLVRDGKQGAAIAPSLLEAQLAGTQDLPSGMAGPLARSVSCMLQVSPLLVNGYRCQGANTFVKLPAEARLSGFLGSGELVQRWAATGREVEQLLPAL
ncbi:RNA polymerase sigma factor [Pseudoduganella sp.]|uniref:RNA polymerase sigma factor n=1 Tax=Pseudoduganella sp. TaxID=1880898 RepID=UPI0035B37E9F